MRMDKKLSASGGLHHLTPHHGLCPWTLLVAPPPDPCLGSCCVVMVRSAWPMLDSLLLECMSGKTKYLNLVMDIQQ